MTVDQMSPVTKGQFAGLHPLTKRDFMGWARNKMFIIIANADNLANGSDNPDNVEAAVATARTARKMLAELGELFAE